MTEFDWTVGTVIFSEGKNRSLAPHAISSFNSIPKIIDKYKIFAEFEENSFSQSFASFYLDPNCVNLVFDRDYWFKLYSGYTFVVFKVNGNFGL